MAATLTPDGELTYISFPIIKTETTSDGDVIVYGKATDGSVDSDEQIVDPDWSATALKEWLNTGGNVRVQHNAQRDPAGKGISVDIGPDGHYVRSLVVEPVAKELVKKGVLTAYSVGIARPLIERDPVARGGRIKGGPGTAIVELSLVDRPANKNCGIQLVKSASDGTPEFTGKMFGSSNILTKSDNTVTLDLPKDVSVAFSPADLAKLLEHRAIAEKRQSGVGVITRDDGSPLTVDKRQMDPDVGGGVDRDKIPGKDFAGRNRSFPIVTPGDVSDAASSMGRAGEDNYSTDKLKRNIIRIARRKGPAFVAELPESWKKELGMGGNKADDGADVGKAKKKPFPGAHAGFTSEHQPPHTEEDERALAKNADTDVDTEDDRGGDTDVDADDDGGKGSEAKPDATKGAKACKECGASYDADSKLRKCMECGAKLPMAKGAHASVSKKAKVMCPGCGANQNAKHGFCSECGKPMTKAEPSSMKNHKFTCLNCHREPLDKGEKFCPGCGTENPGYLPEADAQLKVAKGAKVGKNKKPTPGKGVVGAGAADIQPVPEHREPDGVDVEALESDAGLPTVPDSTVQMKAATRLKSIGVSNEMGALHDLLCPVFHPADANKAHPVGTLNTLDTGVWQEKASQAVFGGSMADAGKATVIWQAAETIKGSDPTMLQELRDEAHKAFRDANPGPGTFPTPMELSPTRFRRPLITDGHESPSPGHEGSNTAAVPTSDIAATQFNRDYLTAGHATDSPSNKGTAILPAPVPTGAPQRTYYRNTQRDAARSAMAAMHDHIAQTFPDLCAMNGPGVGGEAPVGVRPVPNPVGKSVKKGKKPSKPRTKDKKPVASVSKAAGSVDVEALLTRVREEISTELQMVTKALKAERKRTDELQKSLDILADLPDPNVVAFRGIAPNPMTTKSSAAPVGLPSVAETAERQQAALMQALHQQARNSPNPSEREAAWTKLYQMNGLA